MMPQRANLHRLTQNPIPASFLRGGTSKGIFINRASLPEDRTHWDPIFLGIMGSPDPEHGRQLNGMGGGISSLSKICVVEKPTQAQIDEGIDVVYTFVQVGIRDSSIDYSGNCGNLSSMIGVFSVDEGIGLLRPERLNSTGKAATVRSLNTNTNKIVETTFPIVSDTQGLTPILNLEQATVAGVPGKASQIILDFISPAGARTGKLLPTGNPVDYIDIKVSGNPSRLRVSLVDATNPTVFISYEDLHSVLHLDAAQPVDFHDDHVRITMESIRQRGATLMGLDPTAQAQPKIAALSPPKADDGDADIVIQAFSMGVLHKAVPMTVGLCLGVASGVQNTLAYDIVRRARKERRKESSDLITMRHAGGIVDVGAKSDSEGSVLSARVIRTGRRLMKGMVWWQ
jgi:2-methylaconitate cis-trans-isomerase PrpF